MNPFFLERKFNQESDREYVKTLWNYLIPNEFYIYTCRNDNFITLNKLLLKYQNAFGILNNFILEDSNNFLLFNKYFKKNALLYQYVYSNLFPKYFCRVDDNGVKSKLAFEVAQAGYQNQHQSLSFVQLPAKQEQPEMVDEVVENVEKSTPPAKTMQKCQKRKVKNANIIAEKKFTEEKKTR